METPSTARSRKPRAASASDRKVPDALEASSDPSPPVSQPATQPAQNAGPPAAARRLPSLDARSPFAPRVSPFSAQRGASLWRHLRLPWTLYRYIILDSLRSALFAVFSVSALCSAVVAYQTVESGLQLAYIWPFLAKTFAYPIFFSLPMAVLFGVTLTHSRMSADLEIDAIRLHGGSHAQVFLPSLLLGGIAFVAAHHFNHQIMPEIRYEKRNLEQYIVRQIEDLGSGTNRTILLPEGGGSLVVEQYSGLELHRVHIELHRGFQSRFVPDVRERLPQKLPEKITLLALHGRIEIAPSRGGLTLHLRSVDILVPEKIRDSRTGSDRFIQKFSISEEISIPLSFERRERSVKDRTSDDLTRTLERYEGRLALDPDDADAVRSIRRGQAEWHRRTAFSLSALTFPILGAALALVFRMRSRVLPMVFASGVVLAVFYPLLMMGGYLAERGLLPGLSYALPNLAVIAIALLLARRIVKR